MQFPTLSYRSRLLCARPSPPCDQAAPQKDAITEAETATAGSGLREGDGGGSCQFGLKRKGLPCRREYFAVSSSHSVWTSRIAHALSALVQLLNEYLTSCDGQNTKVLFRFIDTMDLLAQKGFEDLYLPNIWWSTYNLPNTLTHKYIYIYINITREHPCLQSQVVSPSLEVKLDMMQS